MHGLPPLCLRHNFLPFDPSSGCLSCTLFVQNFLGIIVVLDGSSSVQHGDAEDDAPKVMSAAVTVALQHVCVRTLTVEIEH